MSFSQIGVKMEKQNCAKCGHKFTYKERFLACLNSNYICCKDCGTERKQIQNME